MASVQELILASQAQREESPLVGILKSLAGGVDAYQQSKSNAIQDLVRQTAIQKQQQEMQMQIAAEQRKAAQRAKDQADEQALKESFNSVGGTPPPVMPQQKLTKVRDEKGNVTTSTVYGNDDAIRMTPYQQASLSLREQDLGIKKSQAETKANDKQTRTEASNKASVDQADRLITKIDSALSKVGPTSTGLGSNLAAIPGTKARNLQAELQTIKANLGFAELQAMRASSPTGGALGAIAVQELQALQSTLENLDQGQGEAQLRTNLDNLKKHFQNWRNAVVEDQGGGQVNDVKKSAGERFDELVSSGLSEDQAYQTLASEGY